MPGHGRFGARRAPLPTRWGHAVTLQTPCRGEACSSHVPLVGGTVLPTEVGPQAQRPVGAPDTDRGGSSERSTLSPAFLGRSGPELCFLHLCVMDIEKYFLTPH